MCDSVALLVLREMYDRWLSQRYGAAHAQEDKSLARNEQTFLARLWMLTKWYAWAFWG
jgi:hypothetical protein